MELITLVCDTCGKAYYDNAMSRSIVPHVCAECSEDNAAKEAAICSTQSEDAYHKEVLQIAESLAKIDYEERVSAFCDEFTWDALDDYAQEVAVSSQMRAARQMVAEKANMLSNIRFEEGKGKYCTASEIKALMQQIDKELIERGLRPAKPEDNA